jgi:hypothetical protein
MRFEFSPTDFSEKLKHKISSKSRPLEAELFHANGREGHDKAKSFFEILRTHFKKRDCVKHNLGNVQGNSTLCLKNENPMQSKIAKSSTQVNSSVSWLSRQTCNLTKPLNTTSPFSTAPHIHRSTVQNGRYYLKTIIYHIMSAF